MWRYRLRNQMEYAAETLQTRKVRKRDKNVQLNGKFLFSTEEVLKIADDVKKKPVAKSPRGGHTSMKLSK
ncbi:hypothetical protein LIPSTDRAFT_75314 [Lipomyces starkeyi NRRL Y-11557]|uniref:Uncharacterized protein n=1 Tax=Lipomyces starkeyi NRRL Y-11557 TaxID=675824 RepID=A0A1E3PXM7_LIPST|nr:hypothetical protein LIPSTDRAFT_75314 [Lipomyces starkeyi NRRL Y-11557]